eukprot:1159519-Pyramimonas_sp.AAC.1
MPPTKRRLNFPRRNPCSVTYESPRLPLRSYELVTSRKAPRHATSGQQPLLSTATPHLDNNASSRQ